VEWSAEVEQIRGYLPGTVTPTTQLVLSHKHPDDYQYIAATLEDIRRTHKPLSTRHRIITVQGEIRDIVIIGERLRDDDTGEVIGTQGFYLDVTPTNEERQASISQALAEIADARASIEQAKGVLGFPRNRGGFLYAASGWMAAIFSYSTGGSNPAELWRRRVL
jgi:hypothetical protein